MKKKIKPYNPDMVIEDLKDPRGWTVKNNPRPNPSIDQDDELDWRNYFEWDWIHTVVCHSCILRAKYGSGNCQDNGDYFICLPKDVREGKVPYKKPVKTVQSKLVIGD